jgi:hypothetical protein
MGHFCDYGALAFDRCPTSLLGSIPICRGKVVAWMVSVVVCADEGLGERIVNASRSCLIRREAEGIELSRWSFQERAHDLHVALLEKGHIVKAELMIVCTEVLASRSFERRPHEELLQSTPPHPLIIQPR